MNKYSVEIGFGVHRGVTYEVEAPNQSDAFKKAERKFRKEYPDHSHDINPLSLAIQKIELKNCAEKGCKKAGVNYQDHTVTGIPDVRYYCDEHAAEHNKKSKQEFRRGKLEYQKSVVKNLREQLRKEEQLLNRMYSNGYSL